MLYLANPVFKAMTFGRATRGEKGRDAVFGYVRIFEKSLLMGLTEVKSLVNPEFSLFKRTVEQPLQRN